MVTFLPAAKGASSATPVSARSATEPLCTLQRMLDRLHQLPRPQARMDPDIVSGVRRQLNEQADD